MNEPNPYRSPEAGETPVRQDGAAGLTGGLRGCRRVVLVLCVLVSLYAILHVLSGIATLVAAALPPPVVIDEFSPVPEEFQDLRAIYFRNALVRSFTVLAAGMVLGVFAYLLRRYSRWLLQAADRDIDTRDVFHQLQLFALFGMTASCIGCGGSLLLSASTVSFDAAVILDNLVRLSIVAGFVVSTIAVALGRSAQVRFRQARTLYAFAWIGIILPLLSFAAGLIRTIWLFTEMLGHSWGV